MARNKSGGWNKVLNFIGLVDDESPSDNYGEEYQGDNYGRKDAYVPQRGAVNARQTRPNREITPRRQSYAPTQAPRMNRTSVYGGRFSENGYGEDRYDAAPRPREAERPRNRAAAQPPRGHALIERVETGRANRYDYSPRPAAVSRFGSLDGDAGYGGANPPTRREPQGRGRQRTVMYTVNALEDCCDIIENLLNNNTVIITMDALDGALMQRVVDTLSGAVFALHATIRKASDHTYLIAPTTVEVNDDPYRLDRAY